MSFSPLADMNRRIPAGGRFQLRQSAVSGVGLHHNAGVNSFSEATNPNREVSANYWITNEGVILPNIDEEYRAFTSGMAGYPAGTLADHRNITFEISNSPEGVRDGTWAISDAAFNATVALIGDIYKRYGLGPVVRGAAQGVGVHQDWVPTACPGPYIMSHLSTIIARAEEARTGTTPPPIEEGNEDMKIVKNAKGDYLFADEYGSENVAKFFYLPNGWNNMPSAGQNLEAAIFLAGGYDDIPTADPWMKDLVPHIANARWCMKKAEIVTDTVNALKPLLAAITGIDEKKLAELVEAGLKNVVVETELSEEDIEKLGREAARQSVALQAEKLGKES